MERPRASWLHHHASLLFMASIMFTVCNWKAVSLDLDTLQQHKSNGVGHALVRVTIAHVNGPQHQRIQQHLTSH